MRRSKKSLGRAILVSVLSASMVTTPPVYAADYLGVNKTVSGDVTDGIYAGDASNVTITGSVSGNTEYGEDVSINDKSNITVKGDVDCSQIYIEESTFNVSGKVNSSNIITNDSKLTVDQDVKTSELEKYEGSVTIGGNVTADTIRNSGGDISVGGDVTMKNDDIRNEIGVYTFTGYNNGNTTNASTNIGGNIDVTTVGDGDAVSGSASQGGTADIHVKNDINISGSVGSHTIVENAEGDKKTNFYHSTGLSAGTWEDGKVNAEVGDINVKADGIATGISAWVENPKENGTRSEITITTGSISVDGKKKIEEGVEGELEEEKSKGIQIIDVSGKKGTDYNILVKGDINSSEVGVGIYNDGDKDADVTTNIAVDGTIKATDSAVEIYNQVENSNTLNLTTWKIESGTNQNVIVKKYDKEADKEVLDKEATEKQSANINYIIRHEGTISLEGTRSTIVNGTTFETAHEKEKLTIHVKVDDERKYRVDRVEGGTATATKNADGSWTLIVPKNGGVDIRAVLVAIEQSRHDSGSSSGGGSSSSRPGASNAASGMTTTTTDGATVQTNVTKNNNSTTTAAAVRIGTSTANVTSSVSEQNGTKVTFQNASGNLAGASFKTVGQVSADGTTLVKEDGTTAKMATGMLLAIENADGTSVGCFVDATGKTIATGAFEVYYMLGTDGKLHAHFVNPQGYFMTGIQVINGQTVTFNAVGEMVSVI